jgi:hypothetical protein
METLETYFKNKFKKRESRLQVAKEKKLKGITQAKIYAFLSLQVNVGRFAPVRKTLTYQSSGVVRRGVYHLDYGEFHANWAASNKGCTGFLVAVENFTNQLFVLPAKGKGTPEWLKAIKTFVEIRRDVRCIFLDCNSVATSLNFRDQIYNK